MIKKIYCKYKHIITYIFFGFLSTMINWISYSIIIIMNDNIFLANILSWIIAMFFAFYVNKIYVFQSEKWNKESFSEFFVFFLSRLFTGVLEIISVPFLYNIGLNQILFGIKGLLAKIIINIIVIILNYIFSKFFVFKDKRM